MNTHRPEDLTTRRVHVRLDAVFLANMLVLPAGSTVIAVRAEYDPVAFNVLVQHPDLPPAPHDAAAPYVSVDMLCGEDDGRVFWSPRARFKTVEGWTGPDQTQGATQ